mmetsp:Transcript_11970/g.30699  ORF Transcript_11970/g.30699 Transcript_11970/m.30699 type:complete len:109 (-) Transcript_11970:34-360(-)
MTDAQEEVEVLPPVPLRVICERPCPLGFTKAVIVVAQHCERPEDGRQPSSELSRAADAAAADGVENAPPSLASLRGALPWESRHGRRADWHVLRKSGRTQMVAWWPPG